MNAAAGDEDAQQVSRDEGERLPPRVAGCDAPAVLTLKVLGPPSPPYDVALTSDCIELVESDRSTGGSVRTRTARPTRAEIAAVIEPACSQHIPEREPRTVGGSLLFQVWGDCRHGGDLSEVKLTDQAFYQRLAEMTQKYFARPPL